MSTSGDQFATTKWTLVWQAAAEQGNTDKPAMEQFILGYWQPLYLFARQKGLTASDAEDATQEFLCEALDGRLLAAADPSRGRFRSYLITAWKRFLIDRYRKQSAEKAGGKMRRLSLDMSLGEKIFQANGDRQSGEAESTFHRAWAGALLEQARQRLLSEYVQRGRDALFMLLWPKVTGPLGSEQYIQLASQANMSASAVKVALFRLRQRFGETLRAVIAETVDDPNEIDSELSELMTSLRNS